jgi:nucleoside 2-deoxyribosyltransferase
MKVYIAGKLRDKEETEQLEQVDTLCNSLGLDTFLPHRDVGLAEGLKDAKKIFDGDIINGFKDIKLVIALLDGFHVGAGTSWELGYAYAKGIPAIGLKTDESIEDSFEYLSAILIGSMPIATSLQELRQKLLEFKEKGRF